MSTDALDAAIGALYQSVAEPGAMQGAVRAIRHLVRSQGVSYFSIDAQGNVGNFFTEGFDLSHQQAWTGYYHRFDPGRRPMLGAPAGAWLTDDRLLDPVLTPQPEYVHDFARYAGIRWLRVHKVLQTATQEVFFSVQRPADMPAFDDDSMRTLQALSPHLRRASKLMLELGRDVPGAVEADAALQALDVPMLVSERDGRLVHANASGTELLQARHGLGLRHGRIGAVDARWASALAQAIANACTPPRRGAALALPGGHGDAVMLLRIAPLPQRHGLPLQGEAPRALLVAGRPRPPSADEALRQLFGFTAAEGALAALLLQGLSPKRCAVLRQVRESTIRTQLTRMLTKTQCRSQAQMLSLLASLLPLRG